MKVAPYRSTILCLSLTIISFFSLPSAHSAPPPAPGKELQKGQLPYQCAEADVNQGASVYSENFGYYYSAAAKKWVSAAWCYPVWGFLAASAPQVVTANEAITVYATPNQGSNSAEYAPITASISWKYPGKVVSGCGASDLSCTFIPFSEKTDEWQWAGVHVSMPRTFFINHPGSNCAGRPICAGVTTNAWTFVGSPPCKEQKVKSVEVVMKNKTFLPSTVLVEPGTTVKMCNQDPFPQQPYTADNLNWGDRKIKPGKCITYKVPKAQVRKRANIIINDALHTKMRLKIVVEKSQC